MPETFFGGINFGTCRAYVSIINFKKELIFSHSVNYKNKLINPLSWIIACKELLYFLPGEIKKSICKLAISGASENYISLNLEGKLINLKTKCQPNRNYETLLDLFDNPKKHLSTNLNKLANILKYKDQDDQTILFRNQLDWITGWLMQDWNYGAEENNIKLGWDIRKKSWPKNYYKSPLLKSLPLIKRSGITIGKVDQQIAKKFKLNNELNIITGTSESNAAFLSSGLNKNEGLTFLGKTTVLYKIANNQKKGKWITSHKINGICIRKKLLYSGFGVLTKFFDHSDINELSRQINLTNEKYPDLFSDNLKYKKFLLEDSYLEEIIYNRPVSDSLFLHKLFIELAKIELKGWEDLRETTGSFPEKIVTIGSGARNPQWRSIREKLIKIPIISCRKRKSFGTALYAAFSK